MLVKISERGFLQSVWKYRVWILSYKLALMSDGQTVTGTHLFFLRGDRIAVGSLFPSGFPRNLNFITEGRRGSRKTLE